MFNTFVPIDKRGWRGFVSRYLLIIVFSCMIAILTSAIWPAGYLTQLGYTLCIATPVWLILEGQRALLLTTKASGDWLREVRNVLVATIGIALGFFAGSWLGDTLFFDSIGKIVTLHDKLIGAIITVISGFVGYYFCDFGEERVELADKISAAERDAAHARLKLLTAQLEPHMLFNTLANLRALVDSDPRRALTMLDRLNRYLRVTLTGSRVLTHPLAAEFDRLADYLALMQVRMGPRLHYTLDLPAELRHVSVPPLLLQPLVENSIRHGLGPKVEGGQITVRALHDGQRLVIEAHDTGIGLDETDMATNEGSGFGLTQVRDRLASVYGEAAALELASVPGSGTCATLVLPLQALDLA